VLVAHYRDAAGAVTGLRMDDLVVMPKRPQ
jgi:hypothetical protein